MSRSQDEAIHDAWVEAANLVDALYVSTRARFRLGNGSDHLDNDMECHLEGIEAARDALRDMAEDLDPTPTPEHKGRIEP